MVGAYTFRSIPRVLLVSLLGAAMLLGLGACAATTPQATAVPQEPVVVQGMTEEPSVVPSRFEDIPIPANVLEDQTVSVLVGSGEGKTGVLVYNTMEDPGSLVSFFSENLPLHGWQLIARFERNGGYLTYVKGGRSILIAISGAGKSSHIEIWVGQSPLLGEAQLPAQPPPAFNQGVPPAATQ